MRTRVIGVFSALVIIGGLVTQASSLPTQAQARAATAIVLDISPESSTAGQEVVLTARVNTVNPSPDAPSGTVEFFDLETSLGTATLTAERSAVLKLTSLAAGPHPITVKYLGDERCASSTSAVVNHVVMVQ